MIIKDILVVNVERGQFVIRNVLAVGFMRLTFQTKRHSQLGVNRTPKQTSLAGLGPLKQWLPSSSAQGQKKHGAESTPSLWTYLPLRPHLLATLVTALVKHVEGSSLLVRSRHLPMQSCHMDDPDLVYFLRATCHTWWGDHDRTLPDHRVWQRHPSRGCTIFRGWLGSSLDKARELELGAWESAQGVRPLRSKPLSPLQCATGLTQSDICALIPPLFCNGVWFF